MNPKATDTSLTDAAAQLRLGDRAHGAAAAPGGGGGGDRPDADLDLGSGDDRAARPADARASWRSFERVKRPTVTRTLGCLEREGLVERTPDPADGRSSLVSVNAAGRERLRRLRGRKNAYLARRMRDLPAADVAALERAAEILERMLEGRRVGAVAAS